MRMVRLPRRHKNSVPSWVDVTLSEAGPGSQPTGALVTWPATTAALRSQAEFKPGRGVGEPFAWNCELQNSDC